MESKPYLSDVDSELGSAIRDMATYSAWAKWFASQSLATNNHQLVRQDDIMNKASSIVLDALMNGKIFARGRPAGAIEYEDIPREAWRLAAIRMESDMRALWRAVIFPRSNVTPTRIQKLLSYDSIIVDSLKFQNVWPRSDKPTDKARVHLLKKATREGADPEHIKKLSEGHMATWP
jgi:Fe-S cluster biosynthesis and repair protein YggX